MQFDKEYDASGLACPLPIVKTKKALTDMDSGAVLKGCRHDGIDFAARATFMKFAGETDVCLFI